MNETVSYSNHTPEEFIKLLQEELVFCNNFESIRYEDVTTYSQGLKNCLVLQFIVNTIDEGEEDLVELELVHTRRSEYIEKIDRFILCANWMSHVIRENAFPVDRKQQDILF